MDSDPAMREWRDLSDQVRNWGRWGQTDELGTLNYITADIVAASAALVRRGKVFPLGIEFGASGPQVGLSFRHNPIHLMTVDAGDDDALLRYGAEWENNAIAADPARRMQNQLVRFNDDMIIMPLQAASQWDALSHVFYEDMLYNGFPASSVTSAGAFHCGIDKVDPVGIATRGVLLDVARHRGVELAIAAGQPITAAELDAVAAGQGVDVREGDLVLVRTGWMTHFTKTGKVPGLVAGLDWRSAAWLHEHRVAAVASDNVAVEDLDSGIPGCRLAMHMLCLRDMGLMFGELWDLTDLASDCAEDGIYEFQIVAPPLRVVGGVGSPVNPIAIK